MGAVASKTLADLRHRRLQTAVLAIVMLLACGAATLALGILVASHQPFERAFAAANGAHLVVSYDGMTPDDALAATADADGVTAAAGPWPITVGGLDHWGGIIQQQALSGRPQPDATIDNVTIVAGRWWEAAGEIVLDQDTAAMLGKGVGDTVGVYEPFDQGMVEALPLPKGPGARPAFEGTADPQLPPPVVSAVIVGIAGSVTTPDVAAWLSPSDIALVAGDEPPVKEMLYRVEPSASADDLAAATARIAAGLPSDALVERLTYLEVRAGVNDTADLYVPVLLAFSVFALLAAAFTIANVVGGIVLTSYRDIGMMKAVGFTPRQVSATILIEILVPVAIGSVAGVVLGTLASQPTVMRTAQSFGLPAVFAFSPAVVVAVLAVAIAVAAVAALGPAVRAGRLSTVEAFTRGAQPAAGRFGGWLRRRGWGARAPLPARLGLAAGLAHPGRAVMTLGALVVGVAAVTFSLTTNLSLVRIIGQIDRTATAPVRAEVQRPGTAAAVTAAIAGHPDTGRFVSIGRTQVTIPGAGSIPFVGYDGDASWIGYAIIDGRWFNGPGEVVAPTNLLRQSALGVGDTVEVEGAEGPLRLVIVGEILDTDESPDNLVLRGTWADLAAIDPGAAPDRWEIAPRPGVPVPAFRDSLAVAVGPEVGLYTLDDTNSDEEFLLFLSVITFLGAVLVAVSLGGVFNTVLLETRQRTRELAILKSMGLTPRQVVGMVVSSVLVVGLLAGAIGVPAGLATTRAVLSYMGETAGKTALPDSSFDVLGIWALAGLALVGLAIAVAGAWLPAQRAARTRIAPVLQAE
jgi:putative ABC transport system permease protein